MVLDNVGCGTDIQAVLTEADPPEYDVWVTTSDGRIYHRDPLGDSWPLQYSSPNAYYLLHIQFLDAERGWAAGLWGEGYLSTSDGGVTWVQENPEFFQGDLSAQDMMPELLVARLPSLTQSGEAQTIIDKLIKYQNDPPFDHLRRVKLCTGNDQDAHDALTQEDWYVDHDLETWKYYHPYHAFDRVSMLEALNTGFHFVTHKWHGGLRYWEAADGAPKEERIKWNDLDDSVRNGDMTGIAVTNGCCALFLMDDESIGRHFLTCPTGGAVAYAGTSAPNFLDASLNSGAVVYSNLLNQVYGQDVTRIGSAYANAVFPKRGNGRGRAFENLLGDPLMDIWTDTPGSLTATHLQQVSTHEQPFDVTVLDSVTSSPVEGAVVCLSMYDPDSGKYPLYHVQKTNSSGVAAFTIQPPTTGEITVTVTKHNYLPHRSCCHVGILLSDPYATYPNWGRKFVREPNTDNYHVVFTSSDTVFYSHSSDAGVTWAVPESIGLGTCPAIALNGLIGIEGLVPWVAYLTSNGSIMRAIQVTPETWDKAVIFQGSPGISAGAPSLAASPFVGTLPGPEAHVVYPVGFGSPPLDHYVYFNTFSPLGMTGPEVVDAPGMMPCYSASIAATPGSAVNVCWIRGQRVFYRQRTDSTWSFPWPISSPVPPATEPASNPSLEAYGDYVYCVWHGPNDAGGFPGDVWQRSRWLNWPPQQWANPSNQSQTPSQESDFPVMTTNFVTVWHEQVSQDNTDIWGKFALDMFPQPFFVSPLPSRYPHVDGYWGPGTGQFVCNTVWTEMRDQMLPLYEVKSGVRIWYPSLGKGLGVDPHDGYEPGSYYAAELGRPEQSPYCLSRGGYAKLGSWAVDTSGKVLAYQLPYLDPRQVYKLRAIIYHEGKETWSAAMRCDSGAWSLLKSLPGVPDTVWLRVPRQSYKQDARIILELARVTGDYVSLAELKLFQIEDRAREAEGAQSAGATDMYVTRLRSCTPNPFARTTAIHYELAHAGPVALSVHDVSGRLVRRLESSPRPAGRHVARWDGTDGRGRIVPAGVYFIRLSAGGEVSTGRLTLVR